MTEMTESSLWISPLLILPGVALLILSTSLRYNRLHDEVDHLVYEMRGASSSLTEQLLHRGRLFRNTLISLYVAVAFLAGAGLLGALAVFTNRIPTWVPVSLSAGAVLVLVYASVLLVRESSASLDVIEGHVRDLQDE